MEKGRSWPFLRRGGLVDDSGRTSLISWPDWLVDIAGQLLQRRRARIGLLPVVDIARFTAFAVLRIIAQPELTAGMFLVDEMSENARTCACALRPVRTSHIGTLGIYRTCYRRIHG